MKINIFWFRRDLRLEDNIALDRALSSGLPVLPVFIFDTNITDDLPSDEPRISCRIPVQASSDRLEMGRGLLCTETS